MLALHPDAQRLLELIRTAGRPPIETLTAEEARQAYAAGRLVLQLPPDDVATVRDEALEGGLCVRLYRGAGTADAVLPTLLYLHGGGWVLGDLASHDGVCRRLADLAQCRVVAADYRLAPEHPFPAAVMTA